ncbi:MAG TPA: helix-turn-helix transcriptional regulator, partial [Clostridiaceae bacterium]|nr:helix-turn-helix transcriptional regulator [Clostridiaceae bacterium]
MSRLGKMLKAKRESMGMSLRDFAKICGMSHAYIKNIEDGDPRTGKDITPSLSSIKKLAPALGISVEELLREIGYVQPSDDKLKPQNLEEEGKDKPYKDTAIEERLSHIKEDLITFVTDPQSEEYL